jgi:hypothetical protein
VQHQQNRNDFTDEKAGLRPARRGVVPDQIDLPLWQKSSIAQKVSTSRSNMLTSYGMVGSAQFLESLSYIIFDMLHDRLGWKCQLFSFILP